MSFLKAYWNLTAPEPKGLSSGSLAYILYSYGRK